MSCAMSAKLWILGGLAVASLGVTAPAAALPGLAEANPHASSIVKAARHCWWSGGVRHCRWGGVYGYRSHYHVYNDPDAYRTGSSRWWQEMDRLDRGGRRVH